MTQPPFSSTMQEIARCAELREALAAGRSAQEMIGFVPTMGALHEGHLSLVRASKAACQRTVVSIFVNPTQFGPGEDFEKYPRPVEADLAQLESLGVDFVFAPTAAELYPSGFSTYVHPPKVARSLEGEHRPSHFQGVATVVLKLFELVQPAIAFFGQKDYQQSLVVRHMVRDLNVPVQIEVCPTVRDDDGVALSSRNRFLNSAQRTIARSLYKCLQEVRQSVLEGESGGQTLMNEMNRRLIAGGVTSIDYAVICDPDTLEVLNVVRHPFVALVACHVGSTRLIDNILVE